MKYLVPRMAPSTFGFGRLILVLNSECEEPRNVEDVSIATTLLNRFDVMGAYRFDTLSIRDFGQKIAAILHKNFDVAVGVYWDESPAVNKTNPDMLSFKSNGAYLPTSKLDSFIVSFYKAIA